MSPLQRCTILRSSALPRELSSSLVLKQHPEILVLMQELLLLDRLDLKILNQDEHSLLQEMDADQQPGLRHHN